MVDGVEQPGLFQRIGNFFGADDPNAGVATDPFAGLSRAQRTMLGFSALRDAAASLEGRDSNFFAQSLGGFEQARERERLRAQGEFANRNQQIQNAIQAAALARATGDAGLMALADAQLQALGSTVAPSEMITLAAGGVMPSTGAVPSTVAPAARPTTGGAAMDATGAIVGDIGEEPLSPAAQAAMAGTPAPTTVAPAATTAPAVSPTVADLDRELADVEAQINALIGGMPDQGQTVSAGIAGVSLDDPQAAANLERLQTREERLLEQRNAAVVEAENAAREAAAEEERSRATSARMAPLLNNALSFLTDENGNIRSATSMIASQSGFAAGLMPGVSGADARLARAAIEELAAIAGMSGVAEARASGFGGSLSDADILMIQRSQGIFDLTKPEATVQTLLRLQEEMGASNNRYSDEDQAIIDRYR